MKYSLDKNRMNVLITGASGFIGRHLSDHLESGYNVINLVPEKSHPCMKNELVVDLRQKDHLGTVFSDFKKEHNIHTIIHLASRLVSGEEIEDMDVLYDNLRITEGVVETAKILKPKKIINFSSIAVYPAEEGTYKETSEIKPSVNTESLYGLSKFCSENILDFLLRNEQIIVSHLRVAQVYGEGMREDRIIPVMLKELKEKNAITVFGDGERVSNFIKIEKLLSIVDFFIKNDANGIFNIGDEHLSYGELAQRLIEQEGKKDSRIIKNPKGVRSGFFLDSSKIEKAAGGGHEQGY